MSAGQGQASRIAFLAVLVAGVGLACADPRPMQIQAVADACTRCHGDASRAVPPGADPLISAAPPRSVGGGLLPTDPGVGAHQRHLVAGSLSNAVPCATCHVPPPGGIEHSPQAQGKVTFSGLAIKAWPGEPAPQPVWDGTGCSATYCHGGFRGGNANNVPAWTAARTDACGTCHIIPPPLPHPQLQACAGCHPGYTKDSVDPEKHMNGALDAGIGPGTSCGDCHAIPPATGAHLVHYGDRSSPPLAAYGDVKVLADYLPAGAGYYMFGCGSCHPIDAAKHLDGVLEVELFDAAAPAGSVKALASSNAAYTGGSCSGVYCHSSGQASPAYAATPAWTSGTRLACDGCHGNPPRYPSGGAGTATANSHLVLADDGWEFGHYAGLPGPWHAAAPSAHGAWDPPRDAGPITCQTCHYQTADPAATGPSGFYWLGTDGDYQLPGGDQARLTNTAWQSTQCAKCHTQARGAVLPLHHANGVRDVALDPRTAIGSLPGYPGAPSDPGTAPFWVKLALGGTWWSASLGTASYDPPTKTCSNVGCHLQQTSVRWGLSPVGNRSCDYCHQFNGVPPPP